MQFKKQACFLFYNSKTNMYFVGGCNKEKIVVNNVMRYERYLDKWIKVASLNTPRAKFGM